MKEIPLSRPSRRDICFYSLFVLILHCRSDRPDDNISTLETLLKWPTIISKGKWTNSATAVPQKLSHVLFLMRQKAAFRMPYHSTFRGVGHSLSEVRQAYSPQLPVDFLTPDAKLRSSTRTIPRVSRWHTPKAYASILSTSPSRYPLPPLSPLS